MLEQADRRKGGMMTVSRDDQPDAQPAEDARAGRIDLHNPSINTELAQAGLCAHVHLPTGRTCVLPLHHDEPCDFVPADELPS